MTKAKKSPDPKKRAHIVLAELGIACGPVAVDYIAQRKGITVRFVPLEAELSGMIFVKDSAVIVVNSLHHPNRQRFTLAHEVGRNGEGRAATQTPAAQRPRGGQATQRVSR